MTTADNIAATVFGLVIALIIGAFVYDSIRRPK